MAKDSSDSRVGESLEEYIARLEAINPSTLSENDQLALSLSLQVARKKRERAYLVDEAPELSALERCKRMVLNLSRTERKQLFDWLRRNV